MGSRPELAAVVAGPDDEFSWVTGGTLVALPPQPGGNDGGTSEADQRQINSSVSRSSGRRRYLQRG
jgi:hypothetical protein